MVNVLHRKLHRPERGWDPISAEFASGYDTHSEAVFEHGLLDYLESQIGPLAGLRALDLGGGPGQYTIALAERGAHVVWHDVSRRYMAISQRRAIVHKVQIECSLGYLEDAVRFLQTPFDLIFCRGAWAYCCSDRHFARLIHGLLKPGAAAYVASVTPAFARSTGLRSAQVLLNRALQVKIGHPYAPHSRIAQLFNQLPIKRLVADYSAAEWDKVLIVKAD